MIKKTLLQTSVHYKYISRYYPPTSTTNIFSLCNLKIFTRQEGNSHLLPKNFQYKFGQIYFWINLHIQFIIKQTTIFYIHLYIELFNQFIMMIIIWENNKIWYACYICNKKYSWFCICQMLNNKYQNNKQDLCLKLIQSISNNQIFYQQIQNFEGCYIFLIQHLFLSSLFLQSQEVGIVKVHCCPKIITQHKRKHKTPGNMQNQEVKT
eukprot:TRINITY_DN15310_c0_g1_i2.p1 TRINITY_DN15310_c0_g1~~TRINITY_DN15310_c0_g1_i2.p1  ORF type:complete len:208 (-),score=-27.58 TRINITY_DN15310_c0_g1_i2:169-792(-)